MKRRMAESVGSYYRPRTQLRSIANAVRVILSSVKCELIDRHQNCALINFSKIILSLIIFLIDLI
jgi:hypothetical protein